MILVRRRAYLRAGGTAAAIGLTGCASSLGSGSDPITIGAIEPLSGNFTPWGQAHRSGLEFAVGELNGDGGVLDRDLEIVVTDSGSDPAEADSIFRRFVEQEGAVVATGPVSSDVGILTARTAQELETPIINHMAGSDRVITEQTRYAFRLGILPAATMMRAQAQLIEDAGYTHVGAIIADYAWGRSVEERIRNSIGSDIPVEVAPVDASDFNSFIRNFSQDLEMMVASGHPPGSLTITSQLYELGYEPEVITGAGLPPNVIRGALGEDANRGFTHIHMTDVYTDEFAEVAGRYGEQTGNQMDTHTGYGYVTAQMIAQAIEDAGEADPIAIADAIRGISFDTLFARPIEYSEYGELSNQVQIYSQLSLDAPSYYADGNYSLVEQFRTDPLPPLPPEE